MEVAAGNTGGHASRGGSVTISADGDMNDDEGDGGYGGYGGALTLRGGFANGYANGYARINKGGDSVLRRGDCE